MAATVRCGVHATGRFVPALGSLVRHLLNNFVPVGAGSLMKHSKEHLRTDGLKEDQVYVVITRIFAVIPSYSLGGAAGIYASYCFRAEVHPSGSQLHATALLLTGAAMGFFLAVYALQYRLFHLKFPELQRSKYHQLKARFAPSLVAGLPPAVGCVLLYAYLQQMHISMLEAGNVLACAWPMASCIVLSWHISEVDKRGFL